MNNIEVEDVWAERIEVRARRWKHVALLLSGAIVLGGVMNSAQLAVVVGAIAAVVFLAKYLLNKYVTKSK